MSNVRVIKTPDYMDGDYMIREMPGGRFKVVNLKTKETVGCFDTFDAAKAHLDSIK